MKVRLSNTQKIKLKSSTDIYKVMQAVLLRQNKLRRKQEYFWTIGLSVKLDIEYLELVALGRLNAVNIEPVELFSIAVQKRCKRIVLIHNHTSGDVTPSQADKEMVEQLVESAKILKIEIVDNLIINEEKYFSFADKKLVI